MKRGSQNGKIIVGHKMRLSILYVLIRCSNKYNIQCSLYIFCAVFAIAFQLDERMSVPTSKPLDSAVAISC